MADYDVRGFTVEERASAREQFKAMAASPGKQDRIGGLIGIFSMDLIDFLKDCGNPIEEVGAPCPACMAVVLGAVCDVLANVIGAFPNAVQGSALGFFQRTAQSSLIDHPGVGEPLRQRLKQAQAAIDAFQEAVAEAAETGDEDPGDQEAGSNVRH